MERGKLYTFWRENENAPCPFTVVVLVREATGNADIDRSAILAKPGERIWYAGVAQQGYRASIAPSLLAEAWECDNPQQYAPDDSEVPAWVWARIEELWKQINEGRLT